MLGLFGNLLGSVASGVMGMFGQSSANEANMELDSTRYRRASVDMQAAGLNPAAMYNGGTPGAPPVMQNTMAAPAAAMKDAASSATQQLIAQKTIDHLTEQIAKTNAEKANIVAGTPGVGARSELDVLKTDAIKRIPGAIRTPIYQGGFGADTLRSAGPYASSAAAVLSAGKSVTDTGRSFLPKGLSGPSVASAKGAMRTLKEKYDALPSLTEAEREAARLRNAKRWGWLTGSRARGSVQYQQ